VFNSDTQLSRYIFCTSKASGQFSFLC